MGKLNTQERRSSLPGNYTLTTTKNNPQEAGPSKTNNNLSGGDRDMGDRNRAYRTLNHKSSGIHTQGDNLGKGGNN